MSYYRIHNMNYIRYLYNNINYLMFICILLHLIRFSSSYDANTAQYTPTGRVLQIEYAKQAIEMKGGPIAAVKCEDGILITIARYISRNKLILNEPQKIFLIDNHIMIAASGSLSEGVQLIQIAKQEALKYKELHGCHIPIENLCDYLSSVFHLLTIESKHRPVGVSFIVSGWDDILGPQIYSINPEGNSIAWNAIAIGKKSNDIKKSLTLLMKSVLDHSKQLSIESVYDKFKTMIIKKHFDTSIIKSNIQSNEYIKTHTHHSNDDNNNNININNNLNNCTNTNVGIKVGITLNRLSDIFEIDERDLSDDIFERFWKVETYCCMRNSNGNIDWTLVVDN